MKYRIEVEQDEDGMFFATVPTLPGCVAEGATRKEAIENVKQVADGYIESLLKDGAAVPTPIEGKLRRSGSAS